MCVVKEGHSLFSLRFIILPIYKEVYRFGPICLFSPGGPGKVWTSGRSYGPTQAGTQPSRCTSTCHLWLDGHLRGCTKEKVHFGSLIIRWIWTVKPGITNPPTVKPSDDSSYNIEEGGIGWRVISHHKKKILKRWAHMSFLPPSLSLCFLSLPLLSLP